MKCKTLEAEPRRYRWKSAKNGRSSEVLITATGNNKYLVVSKKYMSMYIFISVVFVYPIVSDFEGQKRKKQAG